MSKIDISGDSFSSDATSSGYSLPVSQRWPALVSSELGYTTIVNRAKNGDQAGDQSYKAQAVARAAGDTVAILVGTNDVRVYKDNATKRGYFAAFLRRLIADAIMPNRVKGRDAAMVKTGAWSNTQVNTFGVVTNAQGAKAAATVSGSEIYVGYIIQNHTDCQSSADVYIDGVKAGTLSANGTAGSTTENGQVYAPALARFATTPGQHSVEVRVTSSGEYFYLDDIRGSDQPVGPMTHVSNLSKWAAAGYTTFGATEAMVTAYNTLISSIVNEFKADGFKVSLVDIFSVINPATDLMADGLHPNAPGQRKIADKFKASIQSTPVTVTYPTDWDTILKLTVVSGVVTTMVEVPA
ncbi:SGNH/GDSL hydrolase family protein [Neorhizobium sp. S3-V5DH]|uniref:SGNH/GDSL hydrolase family protein n=1 Tax=Neorhizobium sp. S3-V5DH TaxID=2485166 RepID=UPI00104D31CF|nr:SGNH/GDSL hydrolase family protein [Neorhizobium sp. S3-V5DH]TCV62337.1 GDSL-like lipase/acylhydrolase family protein [Neorhizobium sp. S3-V5DH]